MNTLNNRLFKTNREFIKHINHNNRYISLRSIFDTENKYDFNTAVKYKLNDRTYDFNTAVKNRIYDIIL